MRAFEPNGCTLLVRSAAGHPVATIALPVASEPLYLIVSGLERAYGDGCTVEAGPDHSLTEVAA